MLQQAPRPVSEYSPVAYALDCISATTAFLGAAPDDWEDSLRAGSERWLPAGGEIIEYDPTCSWTLDVGDLGRDTRAAATSYGLRVITLSPDALALPCEEGWLLTNVFAHELGHAMGFVGHSPAGLMGPESGVRGCAVLLPTADEVDKMHNILIMLRETIEAELDG